MSHALSDCLTERLGVIDRPTAQQQPIGIRDPFRENHGAALHTLKITVRTRDNREDRLTVGKTERVATAGGAIALLGAALWWRTHPSACPYNQRFWVQPPHPFITRGRLREALSPAHGERILEVGPGTGYYTLAVAEWLGGEGRLEILDLQQEMLDHTTRAASERGLFNINATAGDARALPYQSDSFDGAFLVATLGEIPDQDLVLSELARVTRRGGRLVVGELFGDPHWVRFATLKRRAEGAGLRFERRVGGALGYFARFQRV